MIKERTRLDLLRESGRITPREVLEAYRETGLQPVRGAFRDRAGRVCGLTVVAAMKGAWPNAELLPEKAVVEVLTRAMTLECAEHYLNGFVYGFDGYIQHENELDWKSKGWRDGRRAARAVFGEES